MPVSRSTPLVSKAVVRSVPVTLVAAAFLCGACASHLSPEQEFRGDLEAKLEAMQAAVSKQVVDPERAARLHGAVDAAGLQLMAARSALTTFQSTVLALNARPDVTRSEFETLLGQSEAKRGEFRRRLIELHLHMLADTTTDEWKKLAPYERDLLVSPGH